MAKLFSTLCLLGVTVSAAFAQAPATPTAPPTTPPSSTAPSSAVTPAPIEPPITLPASQLAPPPAAPGDAAAVAPVPGAAPATLAVDPNATRVFEFQKDEIGLVLRTLARQANLNIVVSDKVAASGGTVETRLVNMTPREALETVITSKGLILDQVNGVYFVKTQEEKAKEPTESGNFTLSYAQAKDVVPLLQTQLQSGLAPQFDLRTNTVFYREVKSNLDKIQVFLANIDRPTQQVMIEARLVEVTANPQQSYGINWGGVLGGSTNPQTFRYGGTTIATSKIENGQVVPDQPPLVITDQQTGQFRPQDLLRAGNKLRGLNDAIAGQFAILSLPQMSATMRLLNEDRDAEFLANPRVVTANNQKADIKITRLQPVPQLNFNEQTAQAVFSGFQDKEFGNTLEVTPIINKDEFISLTVKPEISNKVADATFTFFGATVTSPVIDKRTLNSNVLIKSGDTLAIGGLLQDEVSKGRTKVPVLGDIPIIGYAFQEKLNARTKRNLLVFVTPTIIRQGYGTGLEDQVSGIHHSGEEFADPNGWRNNAKGAVRLVPTSNRQVAADVPKPGIAKAPRKVGYKVQATPREK
jgi:type IV pilus secretin PilQ/predicted competence protein